MILRFYFKLIFLICISAGHAQIQEYENFKYLGATYQIIIFKINAPLIKDFKVIEFNKSFSEKKIIDSLKKSGSFFACSAALFDSSCRFIGLNINNNKSKSDLNLSSGNGNFFMQPNGYLAISPSTIEIGESHSFDSKNKYQYAFQNGPLLIQNGQINPLFDKTSSNKNLRLGVGKFIKYKMQHLIFVYSKVPVTFYEISSLMLDKFKCDNALSLSGGSMITFHAPSFPISGSASKFPCNMIYIPVK